MTPEEKVEVKGLFTEALADHEKSRPVTAPLPAKSGRLPSWAPWVGLVVSLGVIAGGIIWYLDGRYVTSAHAATTRSSIETSHSEDIRDLLVLETGRKVDVEVLKAKQVAEEEARGRLEKRLDRHERRGH